MTSDLSFDWELVNRPIQTEVEFSELEGCLTMYTVVKGPSTLATRH